MAHRARQAWNLALTLTPIWGIGFIFDALMRRW